MRLIFQFKKLIYFKLEKWKLKAISIIVITTASSMALKEMFYCEIFCLLPLNPWPLVIPRQSSISSWVKTEATEIVFSRCSLAQSTLAEISPPLTWISIMWAFFCFKWINFCWVWTKTRITLQYFFIFSRSRSKLFFPFSSDHFLLDFVKAFLLELYLMTKDRVSSDYSERRLDTRDQTA